MKIEKIVFVALALIAFGFAVSAPVVASANDTHTEECKDGHTKDGHKCEPKH